ncbi:MAG: hypothetical protein ACK4GE_04250, partial [Caldimicrobium sp.]
MGAKRSKALIGIYFFLILGILILLSEYLLNNFGRSLCLEKGCEIVSALPILPKSLFLLIGILYFLILLLLTIIYQTTQGSFFLNFLIFLLASGLSAEFVFLLRQILEYQIICYFCIIIFFLVSILALLYLLYLRSSTFSVFSLFITFLGALIGLSLSFFITSSNYILTGSKYFLIYAEDCPRCKEIIEKGSTQNFEKISYNKVFPLIKIFQLKVLPILIEKGENTWT